MITYISMLRGINVSGQKMIKMSDLRELYELLSYKNVRSYIQSGNVIFETLGKNASSHSKKIEEKIFEKYKFKVPVIIRTTEELKKIIDSNTFLREPGIDVSRLYICFSSSAPGKSSIEKFSLLSFPPERSVVRDKEIFLYCPNGYGNAKLNNNFLENKLGITSTTRNLKTVNELFAMASAIK